MPPGYIAKTNEWNDQEKVILLKDLWENTYHSASKIGKMLGVSRNAVIGKARRLKLKKRLPPVKKIEWDNPRFTIMWDNGVNLAHMAHTFKCMNDTIKSHAAALGLTPRPSALKKAPNIKAKIERPKVTWLTPEQQRATHGHQR